MLISNVFQMLVEKKRYFTTVFNNMWNMEKISMGRANGSLVYSYQTFREV